MSVHVTYVPAHSPAWLSSAERTSAVPQRLPPGGIAAAVLPAGEPPGIELIALGGMTQSGRPGRAKPALVLIDLGMRRTLLYALAGEPLYRDGEEVLCAVLTAGSPQQRWVIRGAGIMGAVVIAPASAFRRLAAEAGTCAYCSGSFAPGDPVVVCGCSAQAVVHGADEGLDCWKRSACTSCGWPLDMAADAAPTAEEVASHGSA